MRIRTSASSTRRRSSRRAPTISARSALNTGNIDSAQSAGWSFTVSDSAIDYLKAGQTLTQKYDVTIDDGHGGSTTQTVTVTLIGAGDETDQVRTGGARHHR